MISFVIPYRDRADLLHLSLRSYRSQEGVGAAAYEILLVDDGSETPLAGILQRMFADEPELATLPIRVFRIDAPAVYPDLFTLPGGAHNPALALNVGIRFAMGRGLVFTSPEVRHTQSTNVARLCSMAETLPLGRALVCDVFDETWVDTEFGGWIGGGPRERPLNFLALYHRDDVCSLAGFEEDYLAGWAFEDTDFAQRWRFAGGSYAFSGPEITAEHQPHPRPNDALVAVAAARSHFRFQASRGMVANRGREWGSPRAIVDYWASGAWLRAHGLGFGAGNVKQPKGGAATR